MGSGHCDSRETKLSPVLNPHCSAPSPTAHHIAADDNDDHGDDDDDDDDDDADDAMHPYLIFVISFLHNHNLRSGNFTLESA